MAIYDITDMNELKGEEYMKLRGPPVQSERERELRKSVNIDRRGFQTVMSYEDEDNFTKLEGLETRAEDYGLVAICTVVDTMEMVKQINEWLLEERIPALEQLPGFLRTRLFVRSAIDGTNRIGIEVLILHDVLVKGNKTTDLDPALLIPPKVGKLSAIRTYKMYYILGPAPRDLTPLHSSSTPSFSNNATATYTLPSPTIPSITSFITTSDKITLRYRLEGSADPDAPLIILSNCILADLGLWDHFLVAFFSHPQNLRYRVLRYDTRGRTSECGTQAINIDLLASDIIDLLNALRIPRAYAAIGVSMGGATVLNAALNHPDRIERFIACDTNAKSPATNRKAWNERIDLAEKEGAVSTSTKQCIVGEELAELTTRRWFTEESYDGGKLEAECLRVKRMVAENSLVGFKSSAQALCDYDFEAKMAKFNGKGLFLVGAKDGVLPRTMHGMARKLGDGTPRLVIIHGAGHLPMVERPEVVAREVTRFLDEES